MSMHSIDPGAVTLYSIRVYIYINTVYNGITSRERE